MIDKTKMLSFMKLREVKPLTDWENIKVGEIYHVPPLIYNKRMDFIVKDKQRDSIKIIKLGDNYSQTMFRTDITSRFISKKLELHGRN